MIKWKFKIKLQIKPLPLVVGSSINLRKIYAGVKKKFIEILMKKFFRETFAETAVFLQF